MPDRRTGSLIDEREAEQSSSASQQAGFDRSAAQRRLGDIKSPSRLQQLREISVARDVFAGLFSARRHKRAAPKNGWEAILLPGFSSDTRYMFAIKRALVAQGYRVLDWGLGFNHGRVPELLEQFGEVLAQRQSNAPHKTLLIGWSLGGYIAREAARDNPHAVDHIITLGSPIVGGPKYTMVRQFYERQGWNLDEIEQQTLDRFEQPLTVPVTAMYSKRDGVVSWQACIDHWSPRVRHIEVACSHLGMTFSPKSLAVLAATTDRLTLSEQETPDVEYFWKQ